MMTLSLIMISLKAEQRLHYLTMFQSFSSAWANDATERSTF